MGACSVPNDDVLLLKHAIKKWQGAIRSNLDKYGLKKIPFDFGGDNCSLCQRHLGVDYKCVTCPIVRFTGSKCDEQYKKAGYNKALHPEHMITLLEDTLSAVEASKNRKFRVGDFPMDQTYAAVDATGRGHSRCRTKG